MNIVTHFFQICSGKAGRKIMNCNVKKILIPVLFVLDAFISLRHIIIYYILSSTVSLKYTYQYFDEDDDLLVDTVMISEEDMNKILDIISKPALRYNFFDEAKGITEYNAISLIKSNGSTRQVYIQYANPYGMLSFEIRPGWHIIIGEQQYKKTIRYS